MSVSSATSALANEVTILLILSMHNRRWFLCSLYIYKREKGEWNLLELITQNGIRRFSFARCELLRWLLRYGWSHKLLVICRRRTHRERARINMRANATSCTFPWQTRGWFMRDRAETTLLTVFIDADSITRFLGYPCTSSRIGIRARSRVGIVANHQAICGSHCSYAS